MKPSARPRPCVRTVKAAALAWAVASTATAIAAAAAVLHDAVRHHVVASGYLLVTALAAISLRLATSILDDITDTEVLHRLRLAETPSSAANLARHLGRRRGPVELSLLRLLRAGLVTPVDSVNGVVRYTCTAD
ncbi:hypothetical protein ACFVUH_08210 [Kitasatospora sp. NPDC058032]|uniref:hypothetical protein n=1 Tax=Kitasatospora sp. NPDC058032 TaxID=3346307 RepID=UPI0036DBB452